MGLLLEDEKQTLWISLSISLSPSLFPPSTFSVRIACGRQKWTVLCQLWTLQLKEAPLRPQNPKCRKQPPQLRRAQWCSGTISLRCSRPKLACSHSACLEGYWPGGRRGCGCVSTLQLWDGVRVGGGGSQPQWHVTGRDSCTFTPGELGEMIKTRQQALLVKGSTHSNFKNTVSPIQDVRCYRQFCF